MICSRCGHDVTAFSLRPSSGPVCRACSSPHSHASVANPFAALVLDHAHDDQGRPIEVTSLRQLQAAEKRHHFHSLVANERSADFDKPPQHRQPDLFEQTSAAGGWLYPEVAESLVRELRDQGEL